MPTAFQKRTRRKRMLAEEFERSNLSRISFCRIKKIPLSTLDWWIRKVRNERSHVPNAHVRPLFIPLAAPQERSVLASRFELYFPDGRKLVLPSGIAIEDVLRFLSVSASS
jgi:hypothetical protein